MDEAKDEQRAARRTLLKRPWQSWVRLLIIIAVVRIALTTVVFSHTIDEPIHILCGLEWLSLGSYSIEEQHPPLARVALAIGPYLAGSRPPDGADDSNMWSTSRDGLLESENYLETLSLARLGILPFFVAACALLGVWSSRWFGSAGAIVATVLLTTTPPVLAHAGLATTDMAAAATIFIALGSLFTVISDPTWKTAMVAGGCVALALLSKFSSIPFLAVCTPVLLFFRWLLGPPMPWRSGAEWRRIFQLAAVGVVVCGLIAWAGLRFSVGPLVLQADIATKGFPFPSIPRFTGLSEAFVTEILAAPIYPAGEIFRGVLEVNQHNHSGHRSYLMGEIRSHGWWYFFPVAFGVKTPIPFLLLGLSSLGVLFVTGFRRRDWRLPALAGCTVVIMACSMTANINLGVRHILVLYPLLALAAASLGPALQHSRKLTIVVALLLGWQAAESIRAHPDYLPYFNQIAGDHPEDFLVGSDLDWGQDLFRLAAAKQEFEIEELYYDIADLKVGEQGETAEWVAVGLTNIKLYPERFGWLEGRESYTLIGKSIRLYHIDGEQP